MISLAIIIGAACDSEAWQEAFTINLASLTSEFPAAKFSIPTVLCQAIHLHSRKAKQEQM
jgi:hypothetical protein